MDRVAALVLAGGGGRGFGALSHHRTKAAFPVAGSYRIIDFVLSNLGRAGIRQVGVVIQYMPASLMEHIGSGRTWEFGMGDRQLRVMTPFVGVDEVRWFHGTADAIDKNINLMPRDAEDVMVVSGEHVYVMDYERLLRHHRQTNADVTMAAIRIPPEHQHPRFGNLLVRQDGSVEAFFEKPNQPQSSIVSMGVFVFKRKVLFEMLAQGRKHVGPTADFNLAADVLQPFCCGRNVQCYMHEAPWYYLGSLRNYFDFHMNLAQGRMTLFDDAWGVITNYADRRLSWRTPAFYSSNACVRSSIIASGCQIEGSVEGSVLFPGVHVSEGAVVRNSIIFHDAFIGRNCVLENVIIDKDVQLTSERYVGTPQDQWTETSEPEIIVE